MTLYMIGIGLFDQKDITLRGLEVIKTCEKVYLEDYTSQLACTLQELETLYGKKITLADREMVEQHASAMLTEAKKSDVAFLVVGDIFSATTHTDLFLRAKEKKIAVECIHNASVMTAIGITGLELYKFGKTTSIVFSEPTWQPQTPYDVLKANLSLDYHTLLLLDIKRKEQSKEHLRTNKKIYGKPRYMTIAQGIQEMLVIEERRKENIFTLKTLCVGCARLGFSGTIIKAGTAQELLQVDFGAPLHCLIVPGKLHFLEEEALKYYRISPTR